jgi:mannitol-1-phosphate/altronate dehydrogenase
LAPNVVHHIHFGPGKFGLGCVIPVLKQVNHPATSFNTILVAYKGNLSLLDRKQRFDCYEAIREQHKYFLSVRDNSEAPAEVGNITDVLYIDSECDRVRILEYLTDPSTVLVTTALGSGISGVAELLVRGLRRRSKNSDGTSNLFVIGCEDPLLYTDTLELQLSESIERLGSKPEEILKGVFFPRVVVDRICPNRPQLTHGQALVADVEPFFQWIVMQDADAPSTLTDLLGPPIRIVTSVDEFDFLEKRKAWLVYSMYLAIAFFAHVRCTPSLRDALVDPYIAARLRLIQEALGTALYSYGSALDLEISEVDLVGICQYAAQMMLRISGGPDYPIRRILADWLLWTGDVKKFQDFLHKSLLRTVEPIDYFLRSDLANSRPDLAAALTELLLHKIHLLEKVSSTLRTLEPAVLVA